MRALLAACLLLAASGLARAEDAAVLSPADKGEIQRVITAQIDAFRHDEGNRAFGYASPKIQGMFGDPQRFMSMVRQAYQPVYHPRSVDFGDLTATDDSLIQHVELIGPDGTTAEALYTMEREADGTWRIDGCALVKTERVAA